VCCIILITMSDSRISAAAAAAAAAGGVAGQEEDTVPLPESGSAAAHRRVVGVNEEEDEEEGDKKAYKNVWEIEKVLKTGSTKANGGWQCLWCNHSFKGWNATKVLRHIAKIPGMDIRPCKARIDDQTMMLYRDLYETKHSHRKEVKKSAELFEESVKQGQSSLAVMFEKNRKRPTKSVGGRIVFDGTVEASCSAQLTMAIADYVHATGLSFSATQNTYFKQILHFARNAPASYTPPGNIAIGTTLLRLNYARRLEQ
jgi:hypothetical protein